MRLTKEWNKLMNKIMTYAGCLASLAAFAVEPEAESKVELEEESVGGVIAEVGVSASYAVTESLSVGAQVNYTWIVDNDSRGAGYMGEGKDQRVWGGLSVAYAF